MVENASDLAETPAHECAIRAVTAGVEAAHPKAVVEAQVSRDCHRLTLCGETVRLDTKGDLLVFGGGKPAGAMAAALVDSLGDAVDGGLVVTEEGRQEDTGPVECKTGTHPLPSEVNVDATSELQRLARETTPADTALVVIGGGASALLCAPQDDVPRSAVRMLTQRLLDSPATIEEINTVRTHLSRVKGGGLAATLAPARTVGLLLSDVAGDDPGVVGSGPTVPHATTPEEAQAVLERYEVDTPAAVTDVLTAQSERGQPASAEGRLSNHVLAGGERALDAAASVCADEGYETVVLAPDIEAAASDAGHLHAAIARSCLASGDPFEPPVALLSGGEATVTVTGEGMGGPNQTLALSAALDLGSHGCGTEVVLASIDTDGIDGPTDAAGALVDGTTVSDRQTAVRALDDDDAFRYLETQNALVRTGPTATNVNDLRVVLVG